MESSEDTAWVFDSLIGFLHGPIWNAPLQTFIEEKSLIFEPTDEGHVPDRKEYVAIYEEYKSLVDLMLGSYMEDIGITPEQFEVACQMSRDNVGGLPSHFHQRLFEQIWAANDYAVFTRMMTQRNVELQLQALELIEQRSGVMPSSYLPGDDQKIDDEQRDDAIMEQVKKLSLEEPHEPEFNTNLDKATTAEDIHHEKISLKSALDNFQREILAKENETRMTEVKFKETSVDDEKPHALNSDEGDVSQENIAPIKPMKEDIMQRQQYLKQQRDKLLALKRQIREKQLIESSEGTEESSSRPKSAKTAKLMLAGGSLHTPQGLDASLQLRKALADRLRSEVVEKS